MRVRNVLPGLAGVAALALLVSGCSASSSTSHPPAQPTTAAATTTAVAPANNCPPTKPHTLGAWRDGNLTQAGTPSLLALEAKHLDVVTLSGIMLTSPTTSNTGGLAKQLADLKTANHCTTRLLLVKDDDLSAADMQAILTNPATRRAHQDYLMQVLADFPDAQGLTLDYEFSLPDTTNRQLADQLRAGLTQLVTNLSTAFRKAGKQLSLTVPVKLSDAYDAGWTKPYFFDFAKLGAVAQLQLMAYDFHWPTSQPGPIAPLRGAKPEDTENVDGAVKFAFTQMYAPKLTLGLAAYGYDWPVDNAGKTDGEATSLTITEAFNLAKAHKAKLSVDPSSGEQHFEYTKNGQRHEVWVSGHKALTKHLAYANSAGLSAIIWRVGDTDTMGHVAIATLR